MDSTTRRVTFSKDSGIKVTASANDETYSVNACICERSNARVLCRSCGFFLENGRVRTPCLVHSQVFYLLDIETCPKCKNPSDLIEIHPYDVHRDYKDLPSHTIKPLKLEPDDPPRDTPDERKNFFHRSSKEVKLPALGSLSTNTNKNRQPKKGSAYRYEMRSDVRSGRTYSYVKK
uniref:Uncharacterized protein n=1 Tax=Cacopsylla melanoneura TaxID=428564 RepID=A0A8D9BEV3_9HEMI